MKKGLRPNSQPPLSSSLITSVVPNLDLMKKGLRRTNSAKRWEERLNCSKPRPDEEGIETRYLPVSGSLGDCPVPNLDLMKKGLRLLNHGLCTRICYVYVPNLDLMKKGLRLLGSDHHSNTWPAGVPNLDLMKKGLRLNDSHSPFSWASTAKFQT